MKISTLDTLLKAISELREIISFYIEFYHKKIKKLEDKIDLKLKFATNEEIDQLFTGGGDDIKYTDFNITLININNDHADFLTHTVGDILYYNNQRCYVWHKDDHFSDYNQTFLVLTNTLDFLYGMLSDSSPEFVAIIRADDIQDVYIPSLGIWSIYLSDAERQNYIDYSCNLIEEPIYDTREILHHEAGDITLYNGQLCYLWTKTYDSYYNNFYRIMTNTLDIHLPFSCYSLEYIGVLSLDNGTPFSKSSNPPRLHNEYVEKTY